MGGYDVATDRPMYGRPTRLYAFAIGSDQAVSSSGTMIVITDKKAYKVPFTDARFVADEAFPKLFESSGHMFALPEAAIVRYAWIDDATDPNTGKDAVCSTVPFEVPLTPNPSDTPMPAATVPPVPFSLNRYPATPATFFQDLPALTCGAMYTKPEIIDMPKETDFWDTSQGTHAKPVWDRIFIGSDGHVANVVVLRFGGSVPVEVASEDTAARGHYKPATFLCSPVASTLDYIFDYSVRT